MLFGTCPVPETQAAGVVFLASGLGIALTAGLDLPALFGEGRLSAIQMNLSEISGLN